MHSDDDDDNSDSVGLNRLKLAFRPRIEDCCEAFLDGISIQIAFLDDTSMNTAFLDSMSIDTDALLSFDNNDNSESFKPNGSFDDGYSTESGINTNEDDGDNVNGNAFSDKNSGTGDAGGGLSRSK